VRRQDSLPIPTRNEILGSPVDSPVVEHDGTTSDFSHQYHQRPPSPIMDNPGAELEREIAGIHLSIPSREEILNSPVAQNYGATSGSSVGDEESMYQFSLFSIVTR